MSKIGRRPIALSGAQVEVKNDGLEVHYKGPHASGSYNLPPYLKARQDEDVLLIECARKSRDAFMFWGLHRALLANAISGSVKLFEKEVKITGLGYKAISAGTNKLQFALGFSHKIDFDIPEGVTVEIDKKTGQTLLVKSADKALLGHVCSMICALRPTEPYKGTGIRLSTDVVIRKAGKTKA